MLPLFHQRLLQLVQSHRTRHPGDAFFQFERTTKSSAKKYFGRTIYMTGIMTKTSMQKLHSYNLRTGSGWWVGLGRVGRAIWRPRGANLRPLVGALGLCFCGSCQGPHTTHNTRHAKNLYFKGYGNDESTSSTHTIESRRKVLEKQRLKVVLTLHTPSPPIRPFSGPCLARPLSRFLSVS